ncbi:hypothetical protein Ancab_000325 [Ancistrocladus abbreviatus]
MRESISEVKVISKPSYADVVRHRASNQEGRSQTPYPLRMGSHNGRRDLQDHEKGVEEHVGMDNIIDDNSSLFSGATANGDINSVPSLGCEIEVEAELGCDCGPYELQSMGWAGLGFNLSPHKASVVPEDRKEPLARRKHWSLTAMASRQTIGTEKCRSANSRLKERRCYNIK